MSFDLKNITSPAKLLPCHKCKSFCTNMTPYNNYKSCYVCQCETNGCVSSWYICTLHGCRYNTTNKRFHQHFDNELHTQRASNLETSLNVNNITELSKNCDTSNQEILNFWNSDYADDSSTTSKDNFSINENIKHNKKLKLYKTNDNIIIDKSIFNKASLRYYKDEIKNPGLGICGIVGRSFLGNNKSNDTASMSETMTHFKITKLCNSISEENQQLLASIFHDLTSAHHFTLTRPPISFQDIRAFYTKSLTSINNNLPCPNVYEYDNHACVSIESIIDHLLLHGEHINNNKHMNSDIFYKNSDLLETKEIKNINKHITSNYGPSIVQELLVIYITIWSDDFEPNHTRTNRNSTWVMTVNISPPKSYKTSALCTLPIALGRKGQFHDNVRHHFNGEIRRLKECKLRYSSLHKKYVPVIVETMTISADRPERSSLNRLLSHCGNSTKRWMYSELIDRNKLKSCDNCFKRRVELLNEEKYTYLNQFKCRKCCDWNMDLNTKHCSFKAPPKYPSIQHPLSPDHPTSRSVSSSPSFVLYPVRVSYHHLLQCVKYASWNYITKTWNKGNFKAYLRLVGIATSYVTELLNKFDDSLAANNVSLTTIIQTIPIPSMWTSHYRLEQCIDTPMHLIFQGIVESIISMTETFFKFHSVWSSFGKESNIVMDNISNLHCEFCRIESFNGGEQYTTGGWIAETFLGYARLSCILPIKTILYLKSENKLAIKEYQIMIQAMYALIARLMSSACTSLEINEYTKLFLSSCDHFDTLFYESNKETHKPFWTTANFLSLLNLPTQIDQFGSLRLHWEGIYERYIQHVKPHLKNMRNSTSFMVQKLQEIHSHNFMEYVIMNRLKDCKKKYNRFRHTHLYGSENEILRAINEKKCIIGFFINMDSGVLYLGLKSNDKKNLVGTVTFEDGIGIHLNNCWFSPIKYETSSNCPKINFFEEDNQVNIDYAILIPFLHFEDKIVRYTFITRSWRVRNCYGDIILPTVSGN